MKKELLRIIKELRKEKFNFKETPPLFRWSYPEEPTVLFELLITEVRESDVNEADIMPESTNLH